MTTRKISKKSKKTNKRFRKTRSKKQKGGDETQEEKLINAARDNELNIVEEALDAGADVNAQGDVTGYTALIWASEKGYKPIVKKLLEKGADVNAKGSRLDYTALMRASAMGHKDIVEILLEKGADVNAMDGIERTALSEARRKEKELGTNLNNPYIEIVKLLSMAQDNDTLLEEWTQEDLDKNLLDAKEEKFIVDKFCKEATYATYFDPMEGTEVTRDIQEYLQEDTDNIMLIYKSNKADTDLEYFGTTRTIITNAFKDKTNLFFGCNKIAEIARVPPESEFNKNDVYFKLSKIGLMGTTSEYCDIKALLENEEHQLFAIKSLNTKYPSFVSHNVLYGEDHRRLVSALHCQKGYTASVSILIKAYPKNEELTEISNSNMLREPVPEPVPKNVFNFLKGGEKPVDECPICSEPMNTVKDLETTGCKHTFHKHCLKDWCYENQTCTCPMCRRAIPNTCGILSTYDIVCGGKRKMKRKSKRKSRKTRT